MSRRGERPAPETLATLPVAVDAMGGDKAPGDIVEGARRAAERARRAGRAGGPARAGGRHAWAGAGRLHRGHRHGRGPGRRGAPQEGLLAGAGRRARARRQGLGHGLGRQHRGDHGLRAAAHGPPARRGAALHRHAAAPPRADAGRAGRRRRQRRVHARHAGAVRPDGRRLRLRPLRHRVAPRSGLLSIGEEPTKGTPLVKETHGLLGGRRREGAARRASSSSATSRGGTSCPRRPT